MREKNAEEEEGEEKREKVVAGGKGKGGKFRNCAKKEKRGREKVVCAETRWQFGKQASGVQTRYE